MNGHAENDYSDDVEFFTPKKDLGNLLNYDAKSKEAHSAKSEKPSPSKSPSKSKDKVTIKTPISSPSKRGIIKLDMTPNSAAIFQIKTPTGRAGLRSPQKRSEDELNKSARKRALKSTVYSRLLDQDEEEDNDFLDLQDRHLAEAVIKESRGEHSKEYASDVEHEEDISEAFNGGKRTRSASKRAIDLGRVSDSDSYGSMIDDELDSENEYVPRRHRTHDKLKRRSINYKSLGGDSVKGNDSKGSKITTPQKKTRNKKAYSPSPVGITPSSVSKLQGSTRRRVGRPSKADEVIGKVKSIFQIDDEFIFNKNNNEKSSSPSKRTAGDDDENSTNLFSFGFDTTEISEIPIVSGIHSSKNDGEIEQSKDPKAFVPFPVPKVDDQGNILDESFLKQHFSNIELFTSKDESNYANFSDEKSFFLNGSEGFFEQSNTRPKLSGNPLSRLAPSLDYSNYNTYVKLGNLLQFEEKSVLYALHKTLYHQWAFELSQGYNINFYGVGSKRKLLLDFVEEFLITWYDGVFETDQDSPKILVVNGYNPTVKFKNVLQDIVTSFIPEEIRKKNKVRFPKHVSETVPFIIRYIENNRDQIGDTITPRLILVFHNIDGEPFRDDKTQNLLSQLCALPEIWLISSVDHLNSSLLWDSSKLKNFNFLWHDLTTYDTYDVEMSFRDVLSMGKSKRFVGNKGAKFVLTSLTSNARNLYKLLLQSQLDAMKDVVATKTTKTGLKGSIKYGIDFKSFYNRCIEQFVTSNEINFRTMLGEFVEHKMCNLAKDEAGIEKISVPFHYDEISSLLAEAFGQEFT